MLQAYNQLTSKRTINNVAHTWIVMKLINILSNATPASKQQQLVQAPVTSSDPTASSAIYNTRHIHHQQTTHSNVPMPTLWVAEQPMATTKGETPSTEGATVARKEGDIGNEHNATVRPRTCTAKSQAANIT